MRARIWRLALAVTVLLGAVAAYAKDGAPTFEVGTPRRGVAVLSSALGSDVSIDELDAFVQTCGIDLVVVDFAWITHHWSRTDLAKVEELALRLRARDVLVAAMYRPRLLRAEDADVHLAQDKSGVTSTHHAELCFAWPDSVDWGARWGERVLVECPSIDHLVLYNVRALCRCAKCADDAGRRHAEKFVAACRERWNRIRPGVRVGHVGMGREYADSLDFLCPFLPVNRGDEGVAVDAASLAEASLALRKASAKTPFVPLAKVYWAQATTNTTEDVAAVIRACDEKRLGFVLWTYGWLFHPEDARYDADALVRALGGDPAVLAPFLHPPEPAKSSGDGRQWVFFDSRETKSGPRLVFTDKRGKERVVAAEADTGLISYLGDRVWGHLTHLGLSLGDTNRVLVRFPAGRRPRSGERVELRLTMHLSEIPPQAPFEVAVHVLDEDWAESAATWNKAPAHAAEPVVTAELPAAEGEVALDVTQLFGAATKSPAAKHGVLLKIARAVPSGTAPIPRGNRGADRGAERARSAMAQWDWAATPEAALERAAAEKRCVLAVVSVEARGQDPDPHESILFSTVLSHPAVTEIVKKGCVPVRISLPAWQFTPYGVNAPDPLKLLGTTAQEASAPALVVARANGSLVASLPSFGTFDYRLVVDFLGEAVAQTGGTKYEAQATPEKILARAKKGSVDRGLALMRLGRFDEAAEALREALPGAGARAGETAYWLGAVLQKLGDARHREVLEELAGAGDDDPWATKAGMRLAWSVSVGVHESLVDPAVGATGSLDAQAVVSRAIDFLLREQLPEGSWPVANPAGSDFQAGISVLAAHALLVWQDELDAPRKEQVDRALRRADRWLDTKVVAARAGELNSFAAAYYVDYLLDLRARKRATKGDVEAAVRKLVGGVCPSGGWSYSLRFGRNWRGNERTHSVNTGLAVAVMSRAKAAGCAVDAKALAGGIKALEAMRKGPGAYTYMWPGEPNFESRDASIARAPLCDLALLRAGRVKKKDLRDSLDAFMELRMELRATGKTSTPFWLPPHAYTSYFFHFAYYHAVAALAELDTSRSKTDMATLRDELLGWVEPDGAWVDDLLLGKPYGTAASLLTLRASGVRMRR